MRFRRNVKLDPSQVQDRRTSGSIRRIARDRTDSKPPDMEMENAMSDYHRYGHFTYAGKRKAQAGHQLGYKLGRDNKGRPRLVHDRPDGADRAQPYKTKYRPDGAKPAKPKKIVVKRRNPDAEMRKIPQQKTIPIPRKTQSK